MVAAFALGAEAVEIGTRFVATTECAVPSFFKERVCTASSDETFILGKKEMPIRILRNKATAAVENMQEAEADAFLKQSGDASYVTEGGNRENATMPCGQSVGVVKKIMGLDEVFVELIEQAVCISGRLGNLFGGGER
jgi:enoyl-[acyl-carrier protein] reductase II